MRHGVVNNKFRMKTAHRLATFSNMAKSLIEHGKIQTTLDKAKYLKTFIEPLVTLGKKGDLAARRQVLKKLHHQETVHRLFDVIAPTFKDRKGGYTRILKLSNRLGDNASMAVIEWTDVIVEIPKPAKELHVKDEAKAVANAEAKAAEKAAKAASKSAAKLVKPGKAVKPAVKKSRAKSTSKK